jgi:hypothetical protein
MMIGALCHDCQHAGLNNTFQVNAKTKLAITYNDISVLENMHASVAFQILDMPNCNILHSLTPVQFKEFRKVMIQAILKTDMANHFEMLSKFNAHLTSKPFSREEPEDRQLLVDILLHSADISNQAKPVNVRKWSDLVLEEFLSKVSDKCWCSLTYLGR